MSYLAWHWPNFELELVYGAAVVATASSSAAGSCLSMLGEPGMAEN